MRRHLFGAAVLGVLLVTGAVVSLGAQTGPFAAQIQLLLQSANTWTGTQTFTNVVVNGSCTGCGGGGYNQSLNTTDTVTFAALTLNGAGTGDFGGFPALQVLTGDSAEVWSQAFIDTSDNTRGLFFFSQDHFIYADGDGSFYAALSLSGVEGFSFADIENHFRLIWQNDQLELRNYDNDAYAPLRVSLIQSAYKALDGTAGVTVTTCTAFKNGLCVAGT